VAVGVGAFDAHLGAVGGEVKPYHLTKIVGTSTCDIMVASKDEVSDNLIKGICGQVDGSVVPGMVGLEAGQSAFGDVYAWFKNVLMWPVQHILQNTILVDEQTKIKLAEEIEDKIMPQLTEEAEKIKPEVSGIVALDWMNGRRTPDANQFLKGAITGLSMGSDAPKIYRALIEATAFGSRAINERFIREGVRIDGVIALGGVAKKSPLVMQIMADVLNMPIKVAASEQTCALGSAMAASVVSGVYNDFLEAQSKMGGGYEQEYYPDPDNAKTYQTLYEKYQKLGQFVEEKLT